MYLLHAMHFEKRGGEKFKTASNRSGDTRCGKGHALGKMERVFRAVQGLTEARGWKRHRP